MEGNRDSLASGCDGMRATYERRKKRIGLFCAWGVFWVAMAGGAAMPTRLIFDTDIGNDCDDAMALALIHALQNRGACELLAVTLTNPDPRAGRMVDAINTFYGRPDIPIGINSASPHAERSRYLGVVPEFPHDFDPERAPSALSLIRRTLAGADDHSVVLVQVGFFTNLADLLESGPDEWSGLSGIDLVRAKVASVSLMAGAFHPVWGENYFPEYNVKFDVVAAEKVARLWPTPMVWSGAEIGEAVRYPAVSIDEDFGYVTKHPVKEAYQRYNPTPHERPCYDLTSVLQAVWPDRGYFELSRPGRVDVLPDSFTRFRAAENGRDRYMLVDPTRFIRVRELFAALLPEPPAALALPVLSEQRSGGSEKGAEPVRTSKREAGGLVRPDD